MQCDDSDRMEEVVWLDTAIVMIVLVSKFLNGSIHAPNHKMRQMYMHVVLF